MEAAARDLLALGPRAVLLKGGHMDGDEVVDLLADASGIRAFRGPRIATASTHGTGCTLASAVAAGIAQGLILDVKGDLHTEPRTIPDKLRDLIGQKSSEDGR